MNSNLPLTLGTAALGMAYGIANPNEMPVDETAYSILDQAWKNGVRCLDTAPAYGEAERRIGVWMRSSGAEPTIVTKLPSLSEIPAGKIEATIRESLEKSLKALGVTNVHGYLTHDAADYLHPAARSTLATLTQERKIAAYGPSVYTADEVFAAIEDGPPGIIQLPVSALDQRMINSGAIEACSEAGAFVFARSLFLQGVMVAPPDQLPGMLARLVPAVEEFQALAAAEQMTPQCLALRFIRTVPGIASAVVGVYSADQLKELVAAAAEPPLEQKTMDRIRNMAKRIPEPLLDPRNWS